MPKRFEILSDPVEERLHKGLTSQVEATWFAANSLLHSISNHTNTAFNATSQALSDRQFVHEVSSTAVKLLAPSSLPGFLSLCALVMRLVHHFMLNRMARNAVSKQYGGGTADAGASAVRSKAE